MRLMDWSGNWESEEGCLTNKEAHASFHVVTHNWFALVPLSGVMNK